MSREKIVTHYKRDTVKLWRGSPAEVIHDRRAVRDAFIVMEYMEGLFPQSVIDLIGPSEIPKCSIGYGGLLTKAYDPETLRLQ